MKKKTMILIAAAVIVLVAALFGIKAAYTAHYNNTHVFIDDAVYEKDARQIDLDRKSVV